MQTTVRVMRTLPAILTDDHEDSGPKEHEDGLEEVSPHDSREPPHDGEHSGQCQQEEGAQVEPLV